MTVSAALKEALMAENTDDVFLTLLTIDHPELSEPIRVVNDHVNHYSRGDATECQDSSSNDNHGTINGTPRFTDGYLRGGLRFFADTDYVSMGDISALKITGALTTEAWVNLDEFQEDGLVLRCGIGASDMAYAVYVDDTGKLQYRWYNSSVQTESTSASVITLNTWHHVALTRNSAGTSIKLYVDGEEVHSATGLSTPAAGGVFTVGGLGDDSLHGTVDEVRIWDTEKAQSAIQDLMHEELAGDEANLVGYWKFNEGNLFIGFNFQLALPTDDAESPPQAQLSIDNVSQEIAIAIRSISTPPSVAMEIVRAEKMDEVEMEFTGFMLRNVKWDMYNVTGDLTVEDFMMEPYPSGIFTPSRFPGLF